MPAIAHTLTQSCHSTNVELVNTKDPQRLLLLHFNSEQERLPTVEFTFASCQVQEADQC